MTLFFVYLARYRTSTLFLNDMIYVLDSQITKKLLKLVPSNKKELKRKINEKLQSLVSFLKEDVFPRITM
jgi:hypothetical protein